MIKITYIVSSFMRCGPINMLHTLISNLDRNYFDVSAITLKNEPDNTRADEFRALGVDIHAVGHRTTHALFGLKKAIREEVKSINPDIVHGHGPWADLYTSLITDVPTIVNAHNKLAEDYVPLYGSIVGTITSLVDAWSMKRVDQVISVSQSVANTIEQQYGINSDVIINGVDTERYHPVSVQEKASLRAQLGLPREGRIFIHVGNMIARKNPGFLIDSFLPLVEQHPNAYLVFLGDGPLLAECKKQASGQNNIIFMGNIANVVPYLQASDCMVSATASDGMSMATLEGLACGLICIMSDIDVHREIKASFSFGDGEFVICKLDNTKQYQEAFLEALTNFRGHNSLSSSELSARRMGAEYSRLYKQLVHQKKH